MWAAAEGFADGSQASFAMDVTGALVQWPEDPRPNGCHSCWLLAQCGRWVPCFVGGGGTYHCTGP